jgi:hypothetical protein
MNARSCLEMNTWASFYPIRSSGTMSLHYLKVTNLLNVKRGMMFELYLVSFIAELQAKRVFVKNVWKTEL